MPQKIHFITYGNANFNNSKKRIKNEAINCGWFDTVNICGPKDLTQEFKTEFNDILKQPRGAGYWIWKFDIIKQQLDKLKNNDILVYIDAGCSININGKKRFDEYIQMLNNSNESIISFQTSHIEKTYTTKQIFKYFDIDINSNHGNTGQYVASVLLMKKCQKMIKIIDECIKVLQTDHLLVTDYYNKTNQCDCFIDNRHDQSILSLVRKKYGSIILNEETWFQPFGNSHSLKFPFWTTRKR